MSRRSKRHWYQFSLRTLLLAVFLVSLPLSRLAVILHQKKQERRVVAELLKLGAKIHYEHGSDDPTIEVEATLGWVFCEGQGRRLHPKGL
ncbi:MAG: hypothetical protein ACYTG0_28670 [Planctomycetota bacterium]|jgi:hypothetical protein